MSLYQKIVFFLLLATLPIQFGKHFWPYFSFVQGIRIDYLSPTLYASDVCFILLFLVSVTSLRIRLQKLFLSKVGFSIALSSIAWLFLASSWQASLFGVVKLIEFIYIAVFVSTYFKRKDIEMSLFVVSLNALVESVIIFFQFFSQHSLGSLFYYLGERTFNPSTPGIATFRFMESDILRPYGTFPHPNVAAFFLLFSATWLLFSIKFERSMINYIKALAITTISFGIFFTFSRIVVILWVGVVGIHLFKKLKPFPIHIKTRVGVLSFVGLVLLLILFFQRFELTFVKDLLLRGELVAISFNIFFTHPIFGTGLNNFFYSEAGYQKTLTPIFLQPVHNIYLLWVAQTGIVGFLVALYFIKKISERLKEFLLRKNKHYFYRFVPVVVVYISICGIFDHYFLTLQQGQLLTAIIVGFCFSKIDS